MEKGWDSGWEESWDNHKWSEFFKDADRHAGNQGAFIVAGGSEEHASGPNKDQRLTPPLPPLSMLMSDNFGSESDQSTGEMSAQNAPTEQETFDFHEFDNAEKAVSDDVGVSLRPSNTPWDPLAASIRGAWQPSGPAPPTNVGRDPFVSSSAPELLVGDWTPESPQQRTDLGQPNEIVPITPSNNPRGALSSDSTAITSGSSDSSFPLEQLQTISSFTSVTGQRLSFGSSPLTPIRQPLPRQARAGSTTSSAISAPSEIICFGIRRNGKICDITFTRPRDFRKHSKIHTEKTERRFSCDVTDCEEKFDKETDLARHNLTHTRARPFNCAFCGRDFPRKDNCKRHEVKACPRNPNRQHRGIETASIQDNSITEQ